MSIEIAIPYWGDSELLRKAVESVRAQSEPDWTMLVVDDCYPEPWAGPWLAGLQDSRIRYVRNEVNLGIIANFQRCLDLASGERLTFMGCDDLLLPDYVALVRELETGHPQVALIQVGVEVIDEEGRPFLPLSDRIKALLRGKAPVPRLDGGERLAASLLTGDWLYWPSLSFRTDVLRGRSFRTDLEILLDLALILDVILEGGSILVDDRPGFQYRRHRSSLSSTALFDGSRFADETRFFAETAERMRRHGWRRAALAAQLHLASRLYSASLVPKAVRQGAFKTAVHLLGHTLALP